MQLRYNFRAYPTPGQQIALAQAFGCARVVYNDALSARREAFESGRRISDGELSKQLTIAKAAPERAWLSEVSSVVLAKSIHDAGWGIFTRMLEEKANRYGRQFGKVNRWFPSTQMCSACGALGGKKPLHVRTWTCVCGMTHDRDLNAAINILAAGRAESSTPVELVSASVSAERPAAKQEPTGSAA